MMNSQLATTDERIQHVEPTTEMNSQLATTDERIQHVEPTTEPWFELIIVIDEGASMIFWQQLITELHTIFEHLGLFRAVRIWKLKTDNAEDVGLYSGMDSAATLQHRYQLEDVVDPMGYRLILVVTDCVSPAWHNGKVQDLLIRWGNKHHVALLQVLPQRLWPRTALRSCETAHVSLSTPGIANVDLKSSDWLPWLENERPIFFPTLTLEVSKDHSNIQPLLTAWAQRVTGAISSAEAETVETPAIVFVKDLNDRFTKAISQPSAGEDPGKPQEHLRAFRVAASPMAYKLVRLLAAAPVTLSIACVIQRSMLPESTQVHIAEVFLGGLLKKKYPQDTATHPSHVEYEFQAGVREALLYSLPQADEYQILREVSAFMEEQLGLPQNFLIDLPHLAEATHFSIPAENRPLARVAVGVWRKLGNEYIQLGHRYIQFADTLEDQLQDETEYSQLTDMLQEQLPDDNEYIQLANTLEEQFQGYTEPEDAPLVGVAQNLLKDAQQATTEEARVTLMDDLFNYLLGVWPTNVVQQALQATRKISNPSSREQVLRRLLKHTEELKTLIEREIQLLKAEVSVDTPQDTISTQVVCPSCFEKINVGECRIIAEKTGQILKDAPKGFWEWLLAHQNAERIDTEPYRQVSACRECPSCGYHLPYNIELVRNLVLGVVGDVSAGKSMYTASLLHQLAKEWVPNTGGLVHLTCLTPSMEEIYRKNIQDPLYEGKRPLPRTPKAKKTTADPLIYHLTLQQSPQHAPRGLNLILYDASGEDFYAYRLEKFARFIFHSGAFIFVIDPLRIPALYTQLPSHLQQNIQPVSAMTYRSVEIVNTTISLFERFHRYASGSSLPNIPIAIMLSKADLLKYLKGPGMSAFLTKPHYKHTLDIEDLNVIHQEVRDLLEKYGQSDLLASTNTFDQVHFFATSATGGPPNPDGYFEKVDPYRCLDPLLWILYCFEIILSGS